MGKRLRILYPTLGEDAPLVSRSQLEFARRDSLSNGKHSIDVSKSHSPFTGIRAATKGEEGKDWGKHQSPCWL